MQESEVGITVRSNDPTSSNLIGDVCTEGAFESLAEVLEFLRPGEFRAVGLDLMDVPPLFLEWVNVWRKPLPCSETLRR